MRRMKGTIFFFLFVQENAETKKVFSSHFTERLFSKRRREKIKQNQNKKE